MRMGCAIAFSILAAVSKRFSSNCLISTIL
jgi:hypothetical protein